MSLVHCTKTTTAERDEEINWEPEMALTSPADTISTSTWTADNGLKASSPTNTTSSAKVFITEGRLGAYCLLRNFIVTTAAKKYDRTIIVEIVPT